MNCFNCYHSFFSMTQRCPELIVIEDRNDIILQWSIVLLLFIYFLFCLFYFIFLLFSSTVCEATINMF